jgi:WD40 repeat protein
MAASDNYLSVGTGSEVYILDIHTLQPITQLKIVNDHERLTFSSNGEWLASSSSTSPIQLWQQQSGKFSDPLVIKRDNVSSFGFDTQGTLLAVGSVDNVYLIDPSTQKEVARIPHTGTVTSVAFAPDGKTLMTASLKVLQFWNIAAIPLVQAEHLPEIACSRVIENFNQEQWDLLFETEAYTVLCPDLPVAP